MIPVISDRVVYDLTLGDEDNGPVSGRLGSAESIAKPPWNEGFVVLFGSAGTRGAVMKFLSNPCDRVGLSQGNTLFCRWLRHYSSKIRYVIGACPN